ncbi:MAG: pantoate--beta-alanine ligase [Chitinophagaceae bacterium]|nr:pantoate--beta-alanine ligase [Chitinophagaceae bacterium]
MVIFKKSADLHQYISSRRIKTTEIGFVPTMGALHEGHLSLIRKSKLQQALTVTSIFVNPTQFNDPKDFEKYPVTLDADIYKLLQAGTDVLYLPFVKEIYPEGPRLNQKYELGYLENILEGKYRPGHFQGVCTVVHRLLNMVAPGQLFLGQKDYQQCLVLKSLINQLSLPVNIHISPTLREPDGLAMSSRNLRLSAFARKKASALYQSFRFIEKNFKQTSPDVLCLQATGLLIKAGFEKVDYIEICDADTLLTAHSINPSKKYIALIAAFIDGVRLIDNVILPAD